MKSIDCWRDLEPFGIKALTGEACRYGMRYLCDVDEKGAKIVRELLGLPYNATLADNWNSGSIGSVMVPYTLFGQLAAFCLLSDGAAAVAVTTGDDVYGYYPEDSATEWADLLEHFRACKTLERTYSPIGGPGVGSRMTHQMSGRTA